MLYYHNNKRREFMPQQDSEKTQELLRAERIRKAEIERKIEHEKLNSPQAVMGAAGKYLEGCETLMRYMMVPFFLLAFAFWPLGSVGAVFLGLTLFCFCAAKISAFSFRDDLKDEADLLQNDPKFEKLLKDYSDSLERVMALEDELKTIQARKAPSEKTGGLSLDEDNIPIQSEASQQATQTQEL